jgi:hypothetical protein
MPENTKRNRRLCRTCELLCETTAGGPAKSSKASATAAGARASRSTLPKNMGVLLNVSSDFKWTEQHTASRRALPRACAGFKPEPRRCGLQVRRARRHDATDHRRRRASCQRSPAFGMHRTLLHRALPSNLSLTIARPAAASRKESWKHQVQALDGQAWRHEQLPVTE